LRRKIGLTSELVDQLRCKHNRTYFNRNYVNCLECNITIKDCLSEAVARGFSYQYNLEKMKEEHLNRQRDIEMQEKLSNFE